MAQTIDDSRTEVRLAETRTHRKRRRSQPGRPCSCGRRWAVRPRTASVVESGIPRGSGAGVTTAALVSLLVRRDELRGTSVLADHLDEAITWGI